MSERWTAQDIPDQSGRVALVTGANSGLGFQTARALAGNGARVLMGCRDATRAEEALARIREEHPDADVEILPLDLADLAAVEQAAKDTATRTDRLDMLVNNAGVMAIPQRTTADGFEMTFGTNHLGHFALTGHLAGLVLSTEGSRIVNVASGAHRFGRMRFDDLMGERRYRKWLAYGQSKLANLLFTRELTRRLAEAGAGTLALAAHPGWAATNLQFAGPRMTGNRVAERTGAVANRLLSQSEEQGALPQLYAATAPDVEPGAYYGPDGFMEQKGYPTRVKTSARARNDADARRLWEVSEELTGVTYDFTPGG